MSCWFVFGGKIERIIWIFKLPLAYLVLFEYELWGKGKKLFLKFISLIKLLEEQASKTPFADVNIATYANMKAWCTVNLLFWESEITCTVVSLAEFLSALEKWVVFILLWPFSQNTEQG